MAKQDKPKPSIRKIKVLRPYLSLLHGQYLDLSLTAFLMLASTGVSLAIPLYAGRFVDAIKDAGGLSALNRNHLIIMVVLLIVQLLGTFFSTVIGARLGLRSVT